LPANRGGQESRTAVKKLSSVYFFHIGIVNLIFKIS